MKKDNDIFLLTKKSFKSCSDYWVDSLRKYRSSRSKGGYKGYYLAECEFSICCAGMVFYVFLIFGSFIVDAITVPFKVYYKKKIGL